MKGVAEKKTKPYIREQELEVIRCLSNGYSAAEIASKMHLSKRTVETYILNARLRNQCENATHLVAMSLRKGLIK